MNERTEVRRYRVSGRVQGVGFRWWTQKVAGEFDLVGRVRNEADGTVALPRPSIDWSGRFGAGRRRRVSKRFWPRI